jgi:hypothetical protein
MANRVLGLAWGSFARALAPLWIAHGVYAGVMIAVRYALLDAVAGPWGRVALGVLAGVPAYVVVMRIAMPGWLTAIRKGTVDSVSHGLFRRTRALAGPSTQ